MKSVMKVHIPAVIASRARVARVLVAVAFAGLLAGACKDSSGPAVVSTLTVLPTSPQSMTVNTQLQFTATARNSDGDILAVTPTWSIVSGGGTITQTGLFTSGLTAGTTVIAVTCSGITVNITINVGPGAAASIAILPQTTTRFPGQTQTFTAVVRDANNNVITTLTPVWTVANPPGTVVANTGGLSAVFTAGNTLGTFNNSVSACVNTTICDQADVIIVLGPAASIAILPQTTTLFPGQTQTFTATVRDAGGNIITTLTPVWTVANPPGTVVANAGGLSAVFTAGGTLGSFPNSVSACVNTTICDQADVIVVSPPAPPALTGGFTVLGRVAATCTTGSIIGDVGVFQAPGDSPPGTITASCGPVTTGTVHAPGDPATKTAYNNFLAAYIARTPAPGDCDPAHTLTGTLAGITLAPGVYCFSAGAALTGLLTLNGTSTGLWLFKIGTTGTGDLATTGFTVTMAGTALPCNVTWWVRQSATMQDSFLKGTVIAGTGVTVTNGTFNGNMWGGASGTGDATETNAAVTGCP